MRWWRRWRDRGTDKSVRTVQQSPEPALNNPFANEAADIQAVVAWLLECDAAWRPPCVQIEKYADVQSVDEPLVGIPLNRRLTGVATARAATEAVVRFAHVAGTTHFKGEYHWGTGCGAGYVLHHDPETCTITGHLVWVE